MLSIFQDIKQELQCLEDELRIMVTDADPLIKDAATHLVNAGGKRLRPAFCFLGGHFYHYHLQNVLPLAVALELIHMASLVHDDVVDSSMTRRNIPTVKAMWGDKISTYLGGYLFGKSLKLIASYEHPMISKVLADTSVKMCEGEMQQLETAFNINQSIKDYFYRINRKTALLIADSCQLGAVACGAPPSIWKPLQRYGHSIGMAFQITDDILDLVADYRELGKPIGSDLKQGIITLPMIYALKKSPQRERLAEIMKKEEKSEEQIQQACSIIRDSGGVDYATTVTQKYLFNAQQELTKLPDIPAKKTLEKVTEFINFRSY